MASLDPVALLGLVFEYNQLWSFYLALDSGCDRGALHEGGADKYHITIDNQ